MRVVTVVTKNKFIKTNFTSFFFLQIKQLFVVVVKKPFSKKTVVTKNIFPIKLNKKTKKNHQYFLFKFNN